MNIAGHALSLMRLGRLMPWTSWNAALDREMNFYQQCPLDHGYPRFVCETFLDGDWTPEPGSHRYHSGDSEWHGHPFVSQILRTARQAASRPGSTPRARMGDYLVKGGAHAGRGQISALHALDRQPRAVPAARGLRLARRSSLRDRAGQGRHRRLRAGAAVRGERRAQVSGAGAAQRPRAGRQSAGRRQRRIRPGRFAPTIATARAAGRYRAT